MTLFKRDDVKPQEKKAGCSTKALLNMRYAHSDKEVAAAIGELKEGEAVSYLVHGKYSGHHILKHLLSLSGPADVYLMSWALTEGPMREILQLQQSGAIKSVYGLFDWRVPKYNPNAWQVAQNLNGKIGTADCHAKVIVVHNANGGLLNISSQNLTNNIRLEAGVAIGNTEMALQYINFIQTKLNESDG